MIDLEIRDSYVGIDIHMAFRLGAGVGCEYCTKFSGLEVQARKKWTK